MARLLLAGPQMTSSSSRSWLHAAGVVLALGCGDSNDAGGVDAAQSANDGAVFDAGDSADASNPDAAGDTCGEQQIDGCPEPCVNEVGAYWDGERCQPILCCCEGPDCDETYETMEDCVAARTSCPGPQDAGEACGQSAGGANCKEGLVCCYPCGIEGCDFLCTEPCEAGEPGCDVSSGCPITA